jgi:hypothetical protein
MSRHLGERALLRSFEGESRPREREHLASCAACAGRRVQLAREVRLLGGVLRDGPPPAVPVVMERPAAFRRWVPAVLGAGVAVAVVSWGLLGRPPVPAEVADAEPLSLDHVTAALFATDEVEEVAKPVRRSDFLAVQAALRGEWPCAHPDPWLDRDCS